MKRSILLYLAIPALVLFFSGGVWAGDKLNEAISQAIVAHYGLDPAVTEIEIKKNNIKISPDEFDNLELIPMTNSVPRGLLSFQVKLKRGDEPVSKGQIRAKIARFDHVLVTTDRIKRQEVIAPDKYKLERMETTYLTEKPINSADELAGRWARRNIGKNQILTSGMVELIPMITSGREVSILCKTGALSVSARGTALQTGYRGDVIRVKNSQSRKVITCTIVDKETVQVSSH